MDPSLIPPLDIRLGVGPFYEEESYVMWGQYEFNRLVKLGGLTPADSVLDIGCGCGRVAIHIAEYLSGGQYVGLDNLKPLIDWSNANIARKYPQCKFLHVDVYSGEYNKAGSIQANTFRFPFPDNQFSFVLAVSLFTHMFLPDVNNYLREISRILRKDGRLFATFFLLRENMTINIGGQPITYAPARPEQKSLAFNRDTPEKMIAHNENDVLQLYEKAGFEKTFVEYGNWNVGQPQFPKPYQDYLVMKKK